MKVRTPVGSVHRALDGEVLPATACGRAIANPRSQGRSATYAETQAGRPRPVPGRDLNSFPQDGTVGRRSSVVLATPATTVAS
jgi:hypothetical protein